MRAVLLLSALLYAGGIAADSERARQNYLLHCMGCHGESGVGLEGKVPSLRNAMAKISASPEGRDYVLRVPGVTQSSLDDDDTAAVLNWVLAEFSAAEAVRLVAPFSGDEVARSRHRPLLEVNATRDAVLRATTD